MKLCSSAWVAGALMVGAVSVSGCATKGFVREQVGAADARANTRIDGVDQKVATVDIQGHTDATGSPVVNKRLGEERAEAVRLFMNKQGVALNRMATISYGQEAPVADNRTRQGRAENRRVVVIVLA